MATTVDTIARANFTLDASGPAPITWRAKDSADAYVARSATLVCVIVNGTTTLTKTVGDGITLATYGGVADSQVTLQLTAAEIAAFTIGNFTSYEFREGAADPKSVLLKGRITLE